MIRRERIFAVSAGMAASYNILPNDVLYGRIYFEACCLPRRTKFNAAEFMQ